MSVTANKKKNTRQYKLANDIDTASTILASQIKAIAEAGKAIERSALKRETLAVLIARACKTQVGIGTVLDVLDGIENIERKHLR